MGERAGSGPSGRIGFRALVVDDDSAVVEAFREALGHDFAVTGCLTSAEGVAHAADPGLDVAVVDYRLPDGPGLDVVKALGAARPPVPVVFATGFGTYALARDAVQLGAVALLEKPFSSSDLIGAVYRAVGERPARAPRAEAARDDRLRAVIAFLDERLFTGVREKELIEQLGFSRSAFHRFFTDRFGVSFREYVSAERLRLAKYLLATTGLPVSEIATRVGILNPSHFSSWFRDETGRGALDYRKAARGT